MVKYFLIKRQLPTIPIKISKIVIPITTFWTTSIGSTVAIVTCVTDTSGNWLQPSSMLAQGSYQNLFLLKRLIQKSISEGKSQWSNIFDILFLSFPPTGTSKHDLVTFQMFLLESIVTALHVTFSMISLKGNDMLFEGFSLRQWTVADPQAKLRFYSFCPHFVRLAYCICMINRFAIFGCCFTWNLMLGMEYYPIIFEGIWT